MLLKKPLAKVKLKKISEEKIEDNILKFESENYFDLIKLLKRKPQKRHQLYSQNAVIMHKDDSEIYNGFFHQMNKYNKINNINISKYNQKKNENKNFLKQYIGYKLYNKKICRDDVSTLYGNILPLYNKKNYFFSDKFLSGKKIFQKSGLLIKNKRHLNEYYKEVGKRNENKINRDLTYINQLKYILEEKIEKKKLKDLEQDMLMMESVGKVKRNYIKEKLVKYKRSSQYKRNRRFEAMKALELFRKNQMDIENDKEYIKKITKLIEFEEKERKKELSHSKNNHSKNNFETENSNSLFILNRYQNKRYNNKINASTSLEKNKSSINIQSTLYKETTTNSTNNKNETKQTFINNKIPIRNRKRNSINSNSDFSRYTLNDTHEINDKTEYININDTSNNKNPLNLLKNSRNNDTSTKFQTKYKSYRNISSTQYQKSDELSSISNNDFTKTKNYNISDYSNISTQKRGRNNHKIPIRNVKSTFDITKFSDKIKEKENNIKNLSMMAQTLDVKEKGDSKLKLFINLNRLNNFVYMRNNHDFKSFCDNTNIMPKNVTDKINKSFELDDKLQKAHIDYVKLLMEQKIMKYYDKDLLYNY